MIIVSSAHNPPAVRERAHCAVDQRRVDHDASHASESSASVSTSSAVREPCGPSGAQSSALSVEGSDESKEKEKRICHDWYFVWSGWFFQRLN